jgi:hypothetical protein
LALVWANQRIKLTRKKHCGFQRFVVLGKTVHNPSFVGLEFCGQFMQDRYTKNRVQNKLQELSLSMFFWTQVICLSVEL